MADHIFTVCENAQSPIREISKLVLPDVSEVLGVHKNLKYIELKRKQSVVF